MKNMIWSFFSDMGSSFVGELNSFKCDVIIADHHQVSDVEAESNVVSHKSSSV